MLDRRIQSVLFGNGLNLLNEGTPSWDDLLKEIAMECLDKNIPNTLKYEAIILKQPYREEPGLLVTSDGKYIRTSDGGLLYVSGEEIESKLKKDIAKRVSLYKPNEIYRLVSELPVSHFMTTNYDNTLLKQLGAESITGRNQQEQLYSIRRHYTLSHEGQEQYYWPIHGNIDSPRSIMLGFDHYCGALSKVESYVKGGYDIPISGRIASIIKRLQEGIEKPLSWIDLFFMSDVHIIGQGLDYAEMDIWWVLNRRRRIKQKEANLIGNHIVYYPDYDIPQDKRQLLRGFDVDICDLEEYPKLNWMSIYKKQVGNIRDRIKNET